MTELQKEAWRIGVREANNKKKIVPASQSTEMMRFIKYHSQKVGDSIPWIEAYNHGVAIEIGIQTSLEIC